MKSKYLAIVLVVLMVIGLVACGQQAQVPEVPSQEVQQTEPAVQPMEVDVTATPIETETQETPKPAESKELAEDTENGLEEVVESESVEASPEPTPIPTEAPKQEPVVTKAPESATTATAITSTDTAPQQSETEEPIESESAEIQSNNRENWDDEVYSMLTPEQKVVYENASPDSRISFNRKIRNTAEREAEGWTTQWDQSESYGDQWSQISMGQ